jgi:hypothetical protein
MKQPTLYQLVFYIPVDHAELVKQALFKLGVGRYQHYEHCCWQSLGQGQFRALSSAKPFIGRAGKTELVEELRVEMLCLGTLIKDAIKVLTDTHPYETPAFHVIKLENFNNE